MYKKADKPIKKEPNNAIYYLACYVTADIAKAVQDKRKSTGQTHSAIMREALTTYFSMFKS